MIETVKINWLMLVSPLMWTTGIAAVFALLAKWIFDRRNNGVGFKPFFSSVPAKKWLKASVGLIIVGLILGLFKLPAPRLISVKVNNPGDIEFREVTGQHLAFLPADLEINAKNKNHILNNAKMEDNTIVMFWDGYIRTPFLRFAPGNYTFEFDARGSEARGEFSAIKIELEAPDENNYLTTRFVKYVELNSKMKTYMMPFLIGNTERKQGFTGRIRLTYYNDLYVPETKKGRDVWIKKITVGKVK